jgi:hypothetical protein
MLGGHKCSVYRLFRNPPPFCTDRRSRLIIRIFLGKALFLLHSIAVHFWGPIGYSTTCANESNPYSTDPNEVRGNCDFRYPPLFSRGDHIQHTASDHGEVCESNPWRVFGGRRRRRASAPPRNLLSNLGGIHDYLRPPEFLTASPSISQACLTRPTIRLRSRPPTAGRIVKTQNGGGFAIYMEQSDADGDAVLEKPFRPHDRLFARCRLSFEGDRAGIPSLAVGGLVGMMDVEGVAVNRRFGPRDGLRVLTETSAAQDCASV